MPTDELLRFVKDKYEVRTSRIGDRGMIEVDQLLNDTAGRMCWRQVTFTADKGQITCLIGINGVGKSTIMKAIMGLTPINSGRDS